MVTISAPSSSPERTRQEFTGLPFRSTVQAPQSPVPQPSFVPVKPISSLKRSSKSLNGGTVSVRIFPLSRIWILVFMSIFDPFWPSRRGCQHSRMLHSEAHAWCSPEPFLFDRPRRSARHDGAYIRSRPLTHHVPRVRPL